MDDKTVYWKICQLVEKLWYTIHVFWPSKLSQWINGVVNEIGVESEYQQSPATEHTENEPASSLSYSVNITSSAAAAWKVTRISLQEQYQPLRMGETAVKENDIPNKHCLRDHTKTGIAKWSFILWFPFLELM